MTDLTEEWKKGKLEEYKRYYCKTVWFEDIFMARCYNKGQNDEWWALENEKYIYNNVYHIKDIEVLAEVPTYEENEKLKEQLEIAVNGLKFIFSQSYGKDMYDCAKGTLKQLEMLQNPKNVTENVANQKVKHCEKRIDE